jgi:hypothetical protein
MGKSGVFGEGKGSGVVDVNVCLFFLMRLLKVCVCHSFSVSVFLLSFTVPLGLVISLCGAG